MDRYVSDGTPELTPPAPRLGEAIGRQQGGTNPADGLTHLPSKKLEVAGGDCTRAPDLN